MAALAGSPSALGVGTVAAALGGLAGALLPEPFQIASCAVLAASMAVIAAEDFRRFRVPDSVNFLAAAAGLATVWLTAASAGLGPVAATGQALVQMCLCGGALYLLREVFFRWRNVDGLGFGDVKLAGTAGIWLGWEGFAVAVLLAAAGALAVVAARTALSGPWPREERIPLAFYLAPSIWVMWFFTQLAAPPL